MASPVSNPLSAAAAVDTGPPRDVFAFVALTGFAAFMYSVPGEWVPGADIFRPALLTSGLAAGLMFLRRIGKLEPMSLDGARGGALIAFALLTAASVLWSVNPEESRRFSIELLKLVAIYLTMINIISTWRRLAIFTATLVVASIVTSLGVIDWYRTGLMLVEGYRSRWVGVFADPNHMAMAMAIIPPMAVALAARKTTGTILKLFCLSAALLAVIAIVISFSRGGFIGMSVAMGIWAFREKRRLQAVILGAVMIAGLWLFAPDSFWARNETVTTFKEDASAMGRVYAWEVASKISIDRPLLGVGAGGFRYAWPTYAPPQSRKAFVAHNIFLDVIGETGFLGLLFFLMFVGGAVGGAYEASDDPEYGWLARAIGAAVAGYLICALFSGYILSAHLYVLFGMGACAERIARATAGRRVT